MVLQCRQVFLPATMPEGVSKALGTLGYLLGKKFSRDFISLDTGTSGRAFMMAATSVMNVVSTSL